MDLFASRLTHQLQHYVSWRPDPGAMAIDALNRNWTKFQGYANPPWNLVVGQHPLVTRLIKGAFHQRPPQPRYAETWDVAKVTAHINSMGENVTLSINDLTLKTVALLALTRPSRSADLAKLSRVHCKYSPEGVTFAPIALAKQSRQGKPLTDFFFARFPENKNLCPVEAVQAGIY